MLSTNVSCDVVDHGLKCGVHVKQEFLPVRQYNSDPDSDLLRGVWWWEWSDAPVNYGRYYVNALVLEFGVRGRLAGGGGR